MKRRKMNQHSYLEACYDRAKKVVGSFLDVYYFGRYSYGTDKLAMKEAWLLGHPLDKLEEESDQQQQQIYVQNVVNNLIFISYREGIRSTPDVGISSDAGWGCTFRSGQMMVAQALVRHFLGQKIQLDLHNQPKAEMDKVAAIIDLFADVLVPQPNGFFIANKNEEKQEESQQKNQDVQQNGLAILSISSICQSGQKYGIKVGKWLGPYTFCRTIGDVVNNSVINQSLQVVCIQGNGGVPVLNQRQLLDQLQQGQANSNQFGLLLLLPATYGTENIAPQYINQICTIMTFPYCMGLIGGRPGRCMYFVGIRKQQLLYLDPHTAQPASTYTQNPTSFHSKLYRTCPVDQLDPSLAVGFYVSTEHQLHDLLARLSDVVANVTDAPIVQMAGSGDDVGSERARSRAVHGEDEWEEVESMGMGEGEREFDSYSLVQAHAGDGA